MSTSTINYRTHNVDTLKGIIPYCREAIPAFYELGLRFSIPGWRDLFVRLWQQQAQCLSELESKIRDLGGHSDLTVRENAAMIADPEDEPVDPSALDKSMLLRCLNQQSHLMHLYTEARKNTLPFDVRMLLHRHQLQAREAVDHLTSIYLSYASHNINSLHPKTEATIPKFSAA